MAESRHTNSIYVLAGVNGAGKSSILSAPLGVRGLQVFDPDEATDLLLEANPELSRDEANIRGWEQGKSMLEAAIEQRLDFAFETTLGGNSITKLLDRALSHGEEVYMSYVGLERVELHIARVEARVAAGGQDVPEEFIRRRHATSLVHLIQLLPRLTELKVYDNSLERDPEQGVPPEPRLILHTIKGVIVERVALDAVPEWAKPIVAAAS